LLAWAPAPSVTQVPPDVVEHAPAGTDAVTVNTAFVGAVGAADVGVADGAPDVGVEVGTAEPSAHSVNPWLVTLPSDDHCSVEPPSTVTPAGDRAPLYADPLMVMLSKNPSVSHVTAVRIVVRSTLNEHLSLLPWSPAPSVMHSPPLETEHARAGIVCRTEKAATVGAVGAGVVGAAVGDATYTPCPIRTVSIEMSPVKVLPRVATHCTDVVLIGSTKICCVHADVVALCCWPFVSHAGVQVVPVHVLTVRFPIVAPYMW
jgi:hypothetical protein